MPSSFENVAVVHAILTGPSLPELKSSLFQRHHVRFMVENLKVVHVEVEGLKRQVYDSLEDWLMEGKVVMVADRIDEDQHSFNGHYNTKTCRGQIIIHQRCTACRNVLENDGSCEFCLSRWYQLAMEKAQDFLLELDPKLHVEVQCAGLQPLPTGSTQNIEVASF